LSRQKAGSMLKKKSRPITVWISRLPFIFILRLQR
jgi:hypothetical protein